MREKPLQATISYSIEHAPVRQAPHVVFNVSSICSLEVFVQRLSKECKIYRQFIRDKIPSRP